MKGLRKPWAFPDFAAASRAGHGSGRPPATSADLATLQPHAGQATARFTRHLLRFGGSDSLGSAPGSDKALSAARMTPLIMTRGRCVTLSTCPESVISHVRHSCRCSGRLGPLTMTWPYSECLTRLNIAPRVEKFQQTHLFLHREKIVPIKSLLNLLSVALCFECAFSVILGQ